MATLMPSLHYQRKELDEIQYKKLGGTVAIIFIAWWCLAHLVMLSPLFLTTHKHSG